MPAYDTILITLVCGHTRKGPAPSKNEYYCMTCDKHQSVKDVIPAYGCASTGTKMPKKWRYPNGVV